MPAADPDLLRRTPQDMVARVVGTRRIEAVKLALDVGFDPNWQDEAAAIHESGVLAQHDDILRLLIARGASVCLRDPWYDGTAVEWASFFDHRGSRPVAQRRADLSLRRVGLRPPRPRRGRSCARSRLARSAVRKASLAPQPEDWHTPLMRMVVRGKAEAVRVLLAHASVRHPDGRSLLDLARGEGFREIAALLDRNVQ